MKPKVSIILLNCNNEHFTIDCLQSLTHVTYPNIEPIVVDNGSKPESVQKLKAAFPNTILIENAKKHPLYAHITLQKGERSELANLATELL